MTYSMWTFKAEVSYAAHSTHHQGVNDIFALKSITVFSFSLYYTWQNDLRLYNRMILTVITIMFIYLGIVVIWNPWILIWHCRAANQSPRASDDNSALKVNIIVIFYLNPFYVNVPFLYPLKIFGFLKFSRDIEIEKRNFP